jgi:hypothetical protein
MRDPLSAKFPDLRLLNHSVRAGPRANTGTRRADTGSANPSPTASASCCSGRGSNRDRRPPEPRRRTPQVRASGFGRPTSHERGDTGDEPGHPKDGRVRFLVDSRAVSVGTTLLIGTLLLALQASKITRQVGQQQTRAYVYPSFVGFFVSEDMGMEGLPPDWATVLVKIRNYGQSPAKMARAAMSREVWAFPPPPNERRKPVPFIDFAEDRHDIPPGNESENRLDFTLTDLDRDGIEEGKAALYVFWKNRIRRHLRRSSPHQLYVLQHWGGLHRGQVPHTRLRERSDLDQPTEPAPKQRHAWCVCYIRPQI